MSDISRERCERLAHNLRGDWYEATADLITALRAALDAAEARERQAATLLARNLVFDHGSAEEAVEFLGGWDAMTDLVAAHHAAIRTGAKP